MTHHPEIDLGEIRKTRNMYWNAIKHFFKRDGVQRDDLALMSQFSDEANDVSLFVGWDDYSKYTKKLPIEVQVFQVWWYATNEERLADDVDIERIRSAFPDIMQLDRREQKRRLRRATEKWRANEEALSHPSTESDPLMLGSVTTRSS